MPPPSSPTTWRVSRGQILCLIHVCVLTASGLTWHGVVFTKYKMNTLLSSPQIISSNLPTPTSNLLPLGYPFSVLHLQPLPPLDLRGLRMVVRGLRRKISLGAWGRMMGHTWTYWVWEACEPSTGRCPGAGGYTGWGEKSQDLGVLGSSPQCLQTWSLGCSKLQGLWGRIVSGLNNSLGNPSPAQLCFSLAGWVCVKALLHLSLSNLDQR